MFRSYPARTGLDGPLVGDYKAREYGYQQLIKSNLSNTTDHGIVQDLWHT